MTTLGSALYGIDYLLEEKENDFANCGCGVMTDDVISQHEWHLQESDYSITKSLYKK